MPTTLLGTLYLVATPIGNRNDISLRALEVLRQVALIAAEDTRHSRFFLQHHQIYTPLVALHEHNEAAQTISLLARLRQGEDIALISDAGTPLINDPGERLVKAVRETEIGLTAVPGPCAVINALVLSGFSTAAFSFWGFLSSKATLRMQQLQRLSTHAETLIFYETPHRILAALADIQTVFGNTRKVAVVREMTKQFETVLCDVASLLLESMKKDPNQQKGEFVLLIEPEAPKPVVEQGFPELERLLSMLLEACTLKEAVKVAGRYFDAPHRLVYQRALAMKKKGPRTEGPV